MAKEGIKGVENQRKHYGYLQYRAGRRQRGGYCHRL